MAGFSFTPWSWWTLLPSGSILGSFPIVWVLCMCERFHLKVRGLWWRTSKWSLQYIHAFLACHTLRDRSMGTFHGKNWSKALFEHGWEEVGFLLFRLPTKDFKFFSTPNFSLLSWQRGDSRLESDLSGWFWSVARFPIGVEAVPITQGRLTLILEI